MRLLTTSAGRILCAAVLCVVATAAIAGAQSGTVTGQVVHATTREPLDGVTIEVLGAALETRTRANGRYTILSVPPGVYTISARKLGLRGREVSRVIVRSDQSATVDFELDSAEALATVRVEAGRPPVDLRGVASELVLTGEELRALPVVNLAEMLMLSPGFAVLGSAGSLQSLASQRRGDPTQISVRGARPGATVQLLDGIPINHPIFGTAAIDLNPLVLSSVGLSPGYMEAQYGGSVAGVVSMTLREGEERLSGQVDYQTTNASGLMGSGADAATASHHVRAVLAGPILDDRVRVMFGAQSRRAADRAVQFPTDGSATGFIGWNGFGAVDEDQLVGKVTVSPRPALRFSATGITQSRRTLAYDRRFLALYRATALRDLNPGAPVTAVDGLVQGSVSQQSHFLSLRAEQRLARASLAVTHAILGGERETCNVFSGVCLEDRFWRSTRRSNGLFDPFVSAESPVTGTATDFGGETFTSRVTRADVVVDAADHVRFQVGLQHSSHALALREISALTGTVGLVPTATNQYRTRPTETAVYAQSTFDYDFLLATVGIRAERGSAKGTGFALPLRATNGTTAEEVCMGTAPGINETPFTFGNSSGLGACQISTRNSRGVPFLLDSAARLAALDDYAGAETQTAFAPRIGVSFPLGERSALFFNAGGYTKHPLYHDAYSNTGLGTTGSRDATRDGRCGPDVTRPTSDECRPNLAFHQDQVGYVGNPRIVNESAKTFEVGYSSLLGANHGMSLSVFSTEIGSLTNFVTSERVTDIGLTYAPSEVLQYSTVENRDLVATRGVSVALRRQLVGRVGYVLNYTWSHTTEVGLPPDLAAEVALFAPREERESPRNRPHAVNAALFVQFRDDVPASLGRIGSMLLRDTRVALTGFWSKGPSDGQRLESTAAVGGSPIGVESGVDRPANPVNLAITKDLGGAGVRYSLFLRAMNLFNSQACCGGFATIEERRAIATGLPGSQPDERMQYRGVFIGIIARH